MSNDQDTSNITQMNPYSDIRTVKAVLYMPPTLLVKASAEISDIHTKQTSIVADYNNLTIESSCTEEAFSVEYQIRHILQKHLPNSDSSVPIVSYGGVYPRAEIRSRFPETTPAGLYSGNSNQEMVTEENKVINETSYAQGEGGEVQRFPETTPPGLDVGHLNRSMFSEEISVVEVSDDENGESGEEQRLSGGSDDEKKKKKKERNKKKRELKKRKKDKSKGQSVSSNSHNSILSGEKTRPGLVKRVRKIDEPARYDPFCGNSRDGRHGEAIEYQTVNGKWVRSGAVDDHGREIYPDLSTSTSDKAVQDKKKVVDTRKQGKAISAQSLTNSVPPPSNKQSQAVPAQPQTPKPAPAQKSVVPEVERFVSKANVKKTERKEGATTAGIVTPGTVSKTSITPQKQNEEEERSEYFRRAGSERRQKPQENKEARKLKLFTNPLLMGAPKF